MDRLPVFVINLDSRADRWRIMEIQGRLHRLALLRVSADDEAAGRQRFPDSKMSGGALGLWATFDNLIQRLACEGIPAAVVLEDDALLLPGFASRVGRLIQRVPADVALVQLGYLTESSWRPYLSPQQNLAKFLRPRSRLRSLRANRNKDVGAKHVTSLRGGTHALLVFPEKLVHYLPELRPETHDRLPLDMAFIAAGERWPLAFQSVRRSMAGQIPVRSDIQRTA